MTGTRLLHLAVFLVVGVLAVSPASAQMPALQYNAPAGFTPGRGGVDPQVFVDPMLEGSVEVFAFRPFQGDFRTSFLRTLFAERMSPGFNNPQLLTRPVPQAVTIPGADDAMMISFTATQNYYTYVHTRLAILSRGFVAIVENRARSAQRMQANLAAVSVTYQSLRVAPAVGLNRRCQASVGKTHHSAAPAQADPLALQRVRCSVSRVSSIIFAEPASFNHGCRTSRRPTLSSH